jgi:ribosomal protein L1
MMREFDEEERSLLRQLDGNVATPDLILMVRDLGEVLRERGLVIQANVAELAADRLEYLSTGQRR